MGVMYVIRRKTNTATVTKPVSVTFNGNVKRPKPNDVADRRNGRRYRSRMTKRCRDKIWEKQLLQLEFMEGSVLLRLNH